VIEDDQFVAFAAFGRDISGFQWGAIVGRNVEVRPTGHAIIVGSLKEHTAEWPDNVGQGFDLCVIFFGNGLELFQGLFHSFFGHSAHELSLLRLEICDHVCFAFGLTIK
jgi:hypothetical protein